MPPDAIIVVTAVTAAFLILAVTLAWGHHRAGRPPDSN